MGALQIYIDDDDDDDDDEVSDNGKVIRYSVLVTQ